MIKALPVESVHASIAPAATLVEERRALYALAIEMLCDDAEEASDDLLDSPPVRYELGRVLAGAGSVSFADLVACREKLGATRSADGVQVVADPAATAALDPVLRIIETSPGLRPLTAADGQRFENAFRIAEEGVRLARELSPGLVGDLLPHVDLLVILDGGTCHGLASASSRWFPGVVLVEEPAEPIDIAEALVHEGAHVKLFDFAITRSFFGFDADAADEFETSWSRARWPMEQTVCAWHAYTLLQRFAEDAGVADGKCAVGPSSLLPVAGERAAEIGSWLARNVDHLQEDAVTLLRGLLPSSAFGDRGKIATEPLVTGRLRVEQNVRFSQREQRGRCIVAKAATPLELYWINQDEGELLQLISSRADGLEVDEIVAHQAALWGVEPGEARERVSVGLRALLDHALVNIF